MGMAVQREQISPYTDADDRQQRRLRMAVVEVGIAVLIALLFFFVVLGIINLYLPLGTSVRELARSIAAPVTQTQSREVVITDGNESVDSSSTARLREISNRVNMKSASDIAWSTAQVGRSLFDRDAIQTYDRARALIEFDENSYLDIGENSLVVFQQMRPEIFAKETRSFRLLVEGELRGKIVGSGNGATDLQISLPGAELRAQAAAGSGDEVEFHVMVNADQSSTLAIYKGNAEVLVGGKTVRLGSNVGLTIGADGQLSGPIQLPPEPALKSPRDAKVTSFRTLPPKVVFSWKPTESATAYRFVLARDAAFRQILVDERLAGTTFAHGNLKDGRYYWRVHAITDRLESAPSESRQLIMAQDQKPPILRVQSPPKVVHSNTVTIRGRTEPNAKVYVEGRRVPVNKDGAFQYQLSVKPGASLIVIEAVDPAGNVVYETKLVNGKF